MTSQEKFNAAVNVIRNLPKNGSFQPSPDLQLKFYSFFKQATLGPIQQKKPAFWDIPGQAKWYAWKSLGNMTKEDAMNQYIELLKSIVETMSYNEDVETFLTSLGTFYDYVPAHDVDLVLGPVIEKVRSRAETQRKSAAASAEDDGNPIAIVANNSGAIMPVENDIKVKIMDILPISSDETDDEFNDAVEFTPEPARRGRHSTQNSETMTVLAKTADSLQKDLELVNGRVRALELNVAKLTDFVNVAKDDNRLKITPLLVGLIAFCPVAVLYVFGKMRRKKVA